MPFLLLSQCAKGREANTPFSIAGAVSAAPTLASAVQGTAVSGELHEGGSQCSAGCVQLPMLVKPSHSSG